MSTQKKRGEKEKEKASLTHTKKGKKWKKERKDKKMKMMKDERRLECYQVTHMHKHKHKHMFSASWKADEGVVDRA